MNILRVCLTLLTATSTIALILSTTTFPARAAEVVSADLDTLLQGGVTLRSPGSKFSYGGFELFGSPSGTAIPDLSKIQLTANDSALLWQIGEDRRILRAGENYQLAVQFEATTFAPQHILSSATLDIAGATLGTRGDASAEIIMDILDDGATLGSLTVREATTGRQLIDTAIIRGSNQWFGQLQIQADGGSGTAALVFTDFETSFNTVEVPEPPTLVIATIWIAGSSCLTGRRFRISCR
jgi:hypothetical protein